MLPIIDRLTRLGDISVEARLQSLREEAASYPERYRQLTAVKFYLRDILARCSESWLDRVCGATNFGPLLDDIKNRQSKNGASEPVCLVTFNYDLLLDSALALMGTSLMGTRFSREDPQSYIESSIFKLFKLHGSVNWWHQTDRYTQGHPPSTAEIIQGAPDLKLRDAVVDAKAAHRYQSEGMWFVPAIAIPVQSKAEYECPIPHIRMLESLIPSVTEILIIGWKGRETHFTDKLRAGLTNVKALMIVDANPRSAGEVWEYLRATLSPKLDETVVKLGNAGFTTFIQNGEFDLNFGG